MLKIQVFFGFMPCKLLQLQTILEPLYSSETLVTNYQLTWCDFRESTNPYQHHCQNLSHGRCTFFCPVCVRCVAIHVPSAFMTCEIMAQTWFQKVLSSSFTIFLSSVFIYESKKLFCESSIEGYFVLLGWKCRWLSELARGWLLVGTVSLPGIARLQCTGHCNSHNIPQPMVLSAESEYCMLLACWRTYCRGYYFDCDVNEPTNQPTME